MWEAGSACSKRLAHAAHLRRQAHLSIVGNLENLWSRGESILGEQRASLKPGSRKASRNRRCEIPGLHAGGIGTACARHPGNPMAART